MSGFASKDPDLTLKLTMNWSRGDLGPGERVAGDLGWTVQPKGKTAGELGVAAQAHDATHSHAELVGGVPGRFYIVSNRVRTTDDRVLGRAVVIGIAPGRDPQNRSIR